MIFPAPVVWVGHCCYRVPINSNGLPRANYPNPSEKDDYTGSFFEGEKWHSHRLSYFLNKSKICRNPPNRSEGLVLHTCDNKWCINPDHLYLGTCKQNAIDNAKRNSSWREKRKEIQSKIGFPEVSAEGRLRMARANSKRLKEEFKKDPKPFFDRAENMRKARIR